MASIDLIRASNGSGDAVKATVTNARVISSTTLQVDATTNWPSKFIATVGSVDGTGAFVPATVTVFNGILSGGNIEITSFAPGYTDIGNTPGQIVVLKPTTAWANEVADTLAVSHDQDGTLKAGAVDNAGVLATDVVETAKIKDGAVTAGKLAVGSTQLGWAEHSGGVLPTSYTTYATVTATSTGGKVVIRFSGPIANANSGAHRKYSLRVQCDGSTVKEVTDLTLALVSGSSNTHFFSWIFRHTPAAGSHTWNLQLLADGASAVAAGYMTMEVAEVA